ncbi:cadherin-like beta sandwich domain-containing protein [Paenibacillus sp. YAF4_2]|uniref:cadherin-like beta sandwich domain-containing protein n=1 Tax=Paenibacillus sp. YAF4_2 TaxID=3233085 RepID=UPI003F994FBD
MQLRKIVMILLAFCLMLPLYIGHAAAADDDIKVLALTAGGELSPSFSNEISEYDVFIDKSSNPFTFFALRTNDSNARIEYRVNGAGAWQEVGQWTSSGNLTMNPGDNLIELRVTSFDNSATRIINLYVHRPLPNDPKLRKLSVSIGTLSPSFEPTTNSYTVNVPYTTTSTTVTPTLSDGGANLKINSEVLSSGNTSAEINLNVGSNVIPIETISADLSLNYNYTVNVIRAPASTVADISNLTLSSGTLSPAFSSGTTIYSAELANNVSSIIVTPTAAESHASIIVQINGGSQMAVVSGTASQELPLNIGDNTVTILVTAQDDITTKNYTLNVHRRSTNADLSNLSLTAGSLDPLFDSGTTEYEVKVSSATDHLTFKPKLVDPNASISWLNGDEDYIELADDTASPAISLQEGLNTILIKVTSEEGNEKEYTIHVVRESSNAKLSQLSVSVGTLTPVFNENTLNYNLNVKTSVNSLTLRPVVAESHATTEISLNNGTYTSITSGADSLPLSLKIGLNIIEVKVTAESGGEQIYKIMVNRANAPVTSVPSVDPPTNLPDFSDIDGHWAEPLIIAGAGQGWISGFPDGTFRPDQAVSRQEFVVIVTKALGWQAVEQPNNGYTFKDQEQIAEYAKSAFNIAYQKGLITGYKDGSVRPNAEINRLEMAVMLIRTLGNHALSSAVTDFNDDSLIPDWARAYVAAAKEIGIVNGRGGNRFMPSATATRAEAVTMVLHLLEFNKNH